MKDLIKTTELIEYTCANCGGSTWKLILGHRVDGSTFLNTICANDQCVQRRREQLNAPDNTLIVWNEFDITGQGVDESDIRSEHAN